MRRGNNLKTRLLSALDLFTLKLWSLFKTILEFALRLLSIVLLFLFRAFLALAASNKSVSRFNKALKKEFKTFSGAFDLVSALNGFILMLKRFDAKMRSSPYARRILFLFAVIALVLYVHPPSFWRSWTFYQKGTASYYGKGFYLNRTASGELFLPFSGMTAAHKTLPIGTTVMIKNLNNGRRAVARINDRGPYVQDRCIDLSVPLAKKLGMKEKGLAPVEIYVAN